MQEGEIYGILGANGSGKSTLIRILCTLLLPDRGVVRVFGHDAVKEPAAVRPLLNRVSADPSFFKPMSALENLLFFGRAYGGSGPEVRRQQQSDPGPSRPGGGTRPRADAPLFEGPTAKSGGGPCVPLRTPPDVAR